MYACDPLPSRASLSIKNRLGLKSRNWSDMSTFQEHPYGPQTLPLSLSTF
jgi:hypothetical protein